MINAIKYQTEYKLKAIIVVRDVASEEAKMVKLFIGFMHLLVQYGQEIKGHS